MKIALAGKGGAGKTTITAWLGDHLARLGKNVWLVDADTALSLGQASGLDPARLPVPLAAREDLVRQRITLGHGQSMLHLTPEVADLPEALSVPLALGGPAYPNCQAGSKRLLVMGTVPGAGGGCACAANTLLKAVLAELVLARDEWVLVDLEAGVEHLGRGTVQSVDALIVVSEPSLRALNTGAEVARMGRDLGIPRQVLALNRSIGNAPLPELPGLPDTVLRVPRLAGLEERQLTSGSVLGLPEDELVGRFCAGLLEALAAGQEKAAA